jgi:hypothetical protein
VCQSVDACRRFAARLAAPALAETPNGSHVEDVRPEHRRLLLRVERHAFGAAAWLRGLDECSSRPEPRQIARCGFIAASKLYRSLVGLAQTVWSDRDDVRASLRIAQQALADGARAWAILLHDDRIARAAALDFTIEIASLQRELQQLDAAIAAELPSTASAVSDLAAIGPESR